MRLNAEWIKNLHDPTKIDRLDELIDLLIVEVMREHQQCLGNILGLSQRNNQVAQIRDSLVYLNNNYHRVIHERPKHLLVDDGLIVVVAFNRALCLADVELKL